MKNFLSAMAFMAPSAMAFFIDGSGHFGLQPATETLPGMAEDRGMYQATRQSFSLLTDVKSGDNLNLKFNLRIFDRFSYQGDAARPDRCNVKNEDGSLSQNGDSTDCEGRHQDSREPGYEPYTPKMTEVYVEYGMDFCIIEAGRRSREWGLGIFMDRGRAPFQTSASLYDGVNCRINALKYENLSFNVGFDRLVESGASVETGAIARSEDGYGPNRVSDDMDQIFFSMEIDDTKAKDAPWFKRKVGIYFANILGTAKIRRDGEEKAQDVKTDVKFVDLYSELHFGQVAWKNEALFRLGRSGDPNWTRDGGVATDVTGDKMLNKVDAIALAGRFDWTVPLGGSYAGPSEYRQGDYRFFSIYASYAHAPGDRDGYYDPADRSNKSGGNKVRAVAFHRNFKPAYLLFNNRAELDDLRVDGVFDPDRLTNVSVFTIGYLYSSLAYGDFEIRGISAELDVSMPDDLRQSVKQREAELTEQNQPLPKRSIGFSGTHLGYEVDLSYKKYLGKQVELGAMGAIAFPGAAWRTSGSESPVSNYMLMGQAVFHF